MQTGKAIGQIQQWHRSEVLRKILDTIEASVPAGLDGPLILDNYGTQQILDSVARACLRTLETGH